MGDLDNDIGDNDTPSRLLAESCWLSVAYSRVLQISMSEPHIAADPQ